MPGYMKLNLGSYAMFHRFISRFLIIQKFHPNFISVDSKFQEISENPRHKDLADQRRLVVVPIYKDLVENCTGGFYRAWIA